MHVLVCGGSGFIGQALSRSLARHGANVTVLSRNPQLTRALFDERIHVMEWDGKTLGRWEGILEDTSVVINLAGESVASRRWTQTRKQHIIDSRVTPTKLLALAISRLSNKPRVFVGASGIGYYGTSEDRVFDERDGPGADFFADLCRSWEESALLAQSQTTRLVSLRIGMVLDKDGGAIAKMVPPFRAFVGGPIAPGTQWVSWIHRADLVDLIEWILAHDHIAGPVNAVAPGAVTMKEFCRTLGAALKRPSWLPVPEVALRLAFGELASFMTTGQQVIPKVALNNGYQFKYPRLDLALQSLFLTDRPEVTL